MFQAFIDDSGSATDEKRLLLAGYIIRNEDCKSFSDDWNAALQEEPPLKTLHMTQSFRGWSEANREKKIARLVDVVSKYEPLSIECVISARDFKEIILPHAPYDLRHPYFFCFYSIIINSAKLLEHCGLNGTIDFIFDNQGNVGTNALVWYQVVRQMQSPSIKEILNNPPVFQSDGDVLPLQAADMLAWYRRLVREPSCTLRQREIADLMVFHHAVVDISRSQLQQWASAFEKIPGIEEVKGKRGSVKHSMIHIVDGLRPERLIPAMERLERFSKRMRFLKSVLKHLGFKRLWKKISKRRVNVR